MLDECNEKKQEVKESGKLRNSLLSTYSPSWKEKWVKKTAGRLRNEWTSGLDKVKEWPEKYLNNSI